MKVLGISGLSGTGKTTVCENIIPVLIERGYTVGSIKCIHKKDFTIDTEGKNTYRHKMAGSTLVTAVSENETDVLFNRELSIEEILKFYDQDYVIIEGGSGFVCKKIVCGSSISDVDAKINKDALAISGKISETIKEYKGLPAINAIKNPNELCDIIEKNVEDYIN